MARDGLKWFCAVSAATLDCWHDHDLRDLIRVAIYTALRNTALRPHVIYDGPEDAFAAELRAMGASVIFHRSPLCDAFPAQNTDPVWQGVAAGAFLRFEVPVLAGDDAYALYTDCDVMFLRDPDFGPFRPAVFGATSQFSHDAEKDMNSGVMLINVAAMRAILPSLYAFARENLAVGLDQEVLRCYFEQRYMVLDRTLNWKPYWGINDAAQIVHFHGPKPQVAFAHLSTGQLPSNPTWAGILPVNPAGYSAYTKAWYIARAQLFGATI